MQPSTQSRFIVLEGLDGAGTTTQAAALAEHLRASELRVCLTAEPSDGPVGRIARAHVRRELSLDPKTAALVFTADRSDHLERVIRPALRRGEWVVCDRYLLSTLAYQGAEGVDQAWIAQMSASFEVPDLTVVLQVDETERNRRLAGRAGRERYEGTELSDGLRRAYAAATRLLGAQGHRIEVVDASLPAPEVLERIRLQLDAIGG